MAVNNGYKVYTLLVEYSTLTGNPTGQTKPNLPGDPDYIAPVLDLDMCPLPNALPNMNVEVEIGSGLTVEIKLLYGALQPTTSVSGIWSVPERTYQGVIYNVTNLGSTVNYVMRVFYNNGDIREVEATLLGQMLLIGPFVGITKIQILDIIGGDFNDDFNNDFD